MFGSPVGSLTVIDPTHPPVHPKSAYSRRESVAPRASWHHQDDGSGGEAKLGEVAPDFFARRKRTHRAGAEDGSCWKNHLAPHFAHLRPTEVDADRIRAFIEAKLAEGVNPATIRIFVAILSALFTDLAERGIAQANPARNLPRSIVRLMRPTHDPRTTPSSSGSRTSAASTSRSRRRSTLRARLDHSPG